MNKKGALFAKDLNMSAAADFELDLSIELLLSNDMLIMERKRYTFWDALGDIGGFHDGLVLLIQALLMSRYSSSMFEHSVVQGAKYRHGPGGTDRANR